MIYNSLYEVLNNKNKTIKKQELKALIKELKKEVKKAWKTKKT